MSCRKFSIDLQTDDDAQPLFEFAAQAFGPGRFARSAYRLREGVLPVASLGLSAKQGERPVGGITFTPIQIGRRQTALLLGPLVVDYNKRGTGIGQALVAEGVARARAQGFGLILLIGDMPYYGRFGFQPIRYGEIVMPSPSYFTRLLGLELNQRALQGVG